MLRFADKETHIAEDQLPLTAQMEGDVMKASKEDILQAKLDKTIAEKEIFKNLDIKPEDIK